MVAGYLEIKAVNHQELEHYVWNVIYIISEERDILQKIMISVNYAWNLI